MTPDSLSAFRLDGKVAIVTGGSSGLGARFAKVLDAAGAKVVLVARRLERLEALAGELADAPPVRTDLQQTDQLDAVVEQTLEEYGRVDVLANNAGMVDAGPAIDESLDLFTDVIKGNLVAPFALAQRAAKAMLDGEKGGAIVNVASILGLRGVGQIPRAGYAASKGGIVNLTRGARRPVGAQGHPRQRHRPRLVRERDDERHVLRGERPQVGRAPRADGPPRQGGRARRRAAVPRERRQQLRHGADPRGRRRMGLRVDQLYSFTTVFSNRSI
jgi:NAD(P)-dependent dehydrogenase (short-subunit alcohol dehydrogenase family)